jgi:hypothetical protein
LKKYIFGLQMSTIEKWRDPNPAPVVERHGDFLVVRDDMLPAGTKMRGLDYIIGHAPEYAHVKEWVYGSCPATGYAQISLAHVCAQYGKKAVLFMAKRKPENLHEYQRRGLREGGVYHWVDNGMLSVTQARAREYAEQDPDSRRLFPLGLEHPHVMSCFTAVAKTIPAPTEFWTAGSSGTLNRALQAAWPDAEAHVVAVGHKMSEKQVGRATLHVCDMPFAREAAKRDMPPFPSAPNYDAKVWKIMQKDAKPGALFWNVGG